MAKIGKQKPRGTALSLITAKRDESFVSVWQSIKLGAA